MIIGGDYNDTRGANDTLPPSRSRSKCQTSCSFNEVRDTTPVNYTSLSVLETAEVCGYRHTTGQWIS